MAHGFFDRFFEGVGVPSAFRSYAAPKIAPEGPREPPKQAPLVALLAPRALQCCSWAALGFLLAAPGALLGGPPGSWAACAPGGSWAAPGVVLAPPERLLERWRLQTRVWPKSRNSSTVHRFGGVLRPPGTSWRPLGLHRGYGYQAGWPPGLHRRYGYIYGYG